MYWFSFTQEELECLNSASNEINTLETEVDVSMALGVLSSSPFEKFKCTYVKIG